ncbi:hypothetical protein H0H93_014469 [Arthromyces matolae]|nr:hypothetical protein H0H93_014469 [Arthromyces matolae]
MHLSSSIAAAAPTPSPLTNELLSRESLPPQSHINSDFGPSVPILPSDIDPNCQLDQFDSRCAGLKLIRRNNEEDEIHHINAEWNRFCDLPKDEKHRKERIGILVSQTKHLRPIVHPNPSTPLQRTAKVAFDNYLGSVIHHSFEDSELMDEINTMDLQVLLTQFGVMDASKLHDPRLTHVVLYWLRREDINLYCRPTTQVFALANDVITLLKDSKSLDPHPTLEDPHFKPKDNLTEYYKLLKGQHYNIPLPEHGDINTTIKEYESRDATDQNTARSEYISAILLRYTCWKKSRDLIMELGPLVDHFDNELKRPTLSLEAKIVIKAYLWVLTGREP